VARQLESQEAAGHRESLEVLRENFEASQWAKAVAEFTEIEIQLVLDSNIFVCKLDAVFRTTDGRYQIVDWKTGAAPADDADLENRGLQLSLYRIAFATLKSIPLEDVEACFYYVAENKVIHPKELLTVDQLRQRWKEIA